MQEQVSAGGAPFKVDQWWFGPFGGSSLCFGTADQGSNPLAMDHYCFHSWPTPTPVHLGRDRAPYRYPGRV